MHRALQLAVLDDDVRLPQVEPSRLVFLEACRQTLAAGLSGEIDILLDRAAPLVTGNSHELGEGIGFALLYGARDIQHDQFAGALDSDVRIFQIRWHGDGRG